MTKLALTHRDLGLSAGCQEPSVETWKRRTGRTMKLLGSYPLDDAEVLETGSDLLKVTQLDGDRARAQVPDSKSPVFSGTK